jgi:RNA polymerase sigma-70 factor (ECF subfamily)
MAQALAADTADLAYEAAFARHWRDVFRFALAWTNDWGAAEDLTQETFLRLWRHRTTMDWERPILPWLLVTVRRLATDRFRALRRRVVGSAPRLLPDETVRVRWLDAQAALGRLPAVERTALLLTAVDGWTSGQVAEALGTTDGAIRAAASRARARLEDDR